MKFNHDIKPAPSTVNEIELMKQLAVNLKWLRQSNRIPQRVLAEYLNIDRSTYCYYETEKSHPTIVTLKRIADFYRLTVDNLLNKDLKKNYMLNT